MNLHDQDKLDRAVAARLARLANRLVDTSRLKQQLGHMIQAHIATDSPSSGSLRWTAWWRPITTIAAAVLITLSVGWFMLEGGTSQAVAAPTQLAQIYHEMVTDQTPHLKVSSVAKANRLLADQSKGVTPIPKLPGQLQSCCLHHHAGTTLTCALIERAGQRIAVTIADGAKIHSPKGKLIERNSKQFIAHTTDGINMVMAHENGRWLCVMGNASVETLVEVAADIRM